MGFIAERESVTAKQIAAMSLELIANKDYDRIFLNFTRKSLKLGHSRNEPQTTN